MSVLQRLWILKKPLLRPVRELGREVEQAAFNAIEPEDPSEMPGTVRIESYLSPAR
ncbi:MAG: hypothetical protein R3C05_25960 [Pirellulaceae bacterium]